MVSKVNKKARENEVAEKFQDEITLLKRHIILLQQHVRQTERKNTHLESRVQHLETVVRLIGKGK